MYVGTYVTSSLSLFLSRNVFIYIIMFITAVWFLVFVITNGLKTKTQLHQTRLLKNYKTFPTIEGVFEKYTTLLRTSN